ncbi:MAG: hypothetical protein K6U00_06005 [Armatimonadetes bacterium]|nr:hypothetical protein [Armatimonadota bacterium]
MYSQPAGLDIVGKTCPFCQTSIKPGAQVFVCPACDMPHHTECWNENGGCTTFGCAESPAARSNVGVQPQMQPSQSAHAPGYQIGYVPHVPQEVKGWNWGAFALTPIWCAAMNMWGCFIAYLLLNLLRGVGIFISLYFGFKGNEKAWRSREWQSVQHFVETQRVWNSWGIGLIIFYALIAFIYLVGVAMGYYE